MEDLRAAHPACSAAEGEGMGETLSLCGESESGVGFAWGGKENKGS